jgi:hypothetical protein
VVARRDAGSPRPRPRPRPEVSAPPADAAVRRRPGRGLARPDSAQNAQLVAAAGSAVVTAARVGRLLGRSSWRIARQLPGVTVVEQQAQRVRQAAGAELLRVLDLPQQFLGTAGPEEQRVMMLVQGADADPAPLRTAMSELLHRSSESTGRNGREYLFGTIVSQLVPDEARILAALAEHRRFAAVDVVAKQVGRSTSRTVLANISAVATAARVSLPDNTPTYLGRLQSFGLVEFGPAADDLGDQYTALTAGETVREARAPFERTRRGSVRLVRKSVSLTPLGRDFWAACAPERARPADPAG